MALKYTIFTRNSLKLSYYFTFLFLQKDIKDYFLQSPLKTPEYLRIPYKWIPEEIRQQYNTDNIVDNDGYIYVEICKGMYGLKQAARLAYDQIFKVIQHFGYTPLKNNPSLWKHETWKTTFALCVDDFGVKITNIHDADHLIHALKTKYEISVDWSGSSYLGISLDWNYTQGYVDISMTAYIPKMIKKFNHPPPKKKVDNPHPVQPIKYGQNTNSHIISDTSPPLNKDLTKQVQEIQGTLLYYARATDPTLLPALNEISTTHTKPTNNTQENAKIY